MLVKGRISSVNTSANTAEVILLEFDNVITAEIPFYNAGAAIGIVIGQFVVLAVFNNDFNDAVIL